jgi:type II secretory pathway component PulC
MTRYFLAGFVCVALGLGCGSAMVETTEPFTETSGATMAQQGGGPETPPAPALLPGQIRRSELLRVLDEGPALLLSRVVTEPMLNAGKFVGFRIKAFNGEPPKVPALEKDDVLLDLNGQKVERPEEFFAALTSLRKAKRLEVAVLRKGSKIVLGYDIVD